MSKLFTSLPTEVVFQIFSYVDQLDCVLCMRVCRQWYHGIPSYTTALWKLLDVSPDSWARYNDCMIRCLGTHTSTVSIDSIVTPSSILKKLRETNCGIKILHIVRMPALIYNDHSLFSTIEQFSYTLMDLFIDHYPQDASIPLLLNHLPNLVYLKLKFEDFCRERYLPTPATGSYSKVKHSNIRYLRLDRVADFFGCIILVLRCCPRLKVLLLDIVRSLAEGLHPPLIGRIFRLCSHIRHFAWNQMAIIDSRQSSQLQNMSAIYDNNYDHQFDDIQTFLFRGDTVILLPDLIAPLAKAETTLTHLRLVNSQFISPLGQLNNISHLHFPRLTHLELIRVHMEPDQWVAFFAKLHDIEYVMLHCISIADRVLSSFCHLSSLKGLNLCVLGDGPTISQEVLLEFADTLADVNSGIDSLELGSFWNVDDQVLESFARISQLSKLSVSSNYRITVAGVEHFCASNLGKPKSLKLLLYANVDGGIWTYNGNLNLTLVT